MPGARCLAGAALVVGSLLGGVGSSAGQARDCQLVSAEKSTTRGREGQSRRSWITKPVFQCDGGTRIQADSSVHFHGSALHQFYGNVRFVDQGREMSAQFAQFFARTGRLDARDLPQSRGTADGVRVVTLETGDTITGSELVLLQANERRPEDQLTVRGGRPRAVFHTRGSTGTSGEEESLEDEGSVPLEIVGDLIYMEGESLLRARGRVAIERGALQAYGDSTEFDQADGRLLLFRSARILQDSLDVRGDTIEVLMPGDAVEELESRGNGRLRSGGVFIDGKVLRVLFEEDQPNRVIALRRPTPVVEVAEPGEVDSTAVAESAGRGTIEVGRVLDPRDEQEPEVPDSLPPAELRSEGFSVTADSIDVNLPAGELKRVFASGTARAISSTRDSLNSPGMPEELRSDWLAADTVIATFLSPDKSESEAEPDGRRGEYRLDTLLGRVSAKTFYRITPRDTVGIRADEDGRRPLELNYTLGDEIKIFLNADAEVDSMNVENPKGAYFQPVRSAPPPPDSTGTGRTRPIPLGALRR
ncbi:MAG: hypothetical protein BMS9Abin29_1477 [Gemmatimonadota bacterium]|nr:MAG: hypothetical protein BMS9Abin29_1477 [Gemmatimonadota bacterium]